MNPTAADLQRRKQVRLRLRTDLTITRQQSEGKTYLVVKDPVRLRYYRFRERDFFLMRLMDGRRTLPDIQRQFEESCRPERLQLETLEAFAQRLLTSGLALNESPQADKLLLERSRRVRRGDWLQAATNLLYIKIPLFDPDTLLQRLLPWTSWLFLPWFAFLSGSGMLAALLLVATHFDVFRAKLPGYQEFFSFGTALYLWIAMGVVKVLHEFGHGLSCKAKGGEVHEMGMLFLCFSPCLYCNVNDAWTLPRKWERIVISLAGIYVELIVAALATFVWWNTPGHPFLNHLSLSVMLICSVSTVVFNANPLLRYDGYYVLADWLEAPNLLAQANRLVKNLILRHLLGIQVPPEPYRTSRRAFMYTAYAVTSYVYRWVVTYSLLWLVYLFLKPLKLGPLGALLVWFVAGSMVGRPLYHLGKSLYQRGRFPAMRSLRVTWSAGIAAALLLSFFLVPLPVSRIRQRALLQLPPDAVAHVFVPVPGTLQRLRVREGQWVDKDDVLAELRSLNVETALEEDRSQHDIRVVQGRALGEQISKARDFSDRSRLELARATAAGEKELFRRQGEVAARLIKNLEVRAPRAGVVMSMPRIDALGKLWDHDPSTPLCHVGDPQRMWALVPVEPPDYRLLKEDQSCNPDLEVTVRVPGGEGRTYRAKVAQVPESEAKTVPWQLTTRGGGPLAVKPHAPARTCVPQTQQYLVAIEILAADEGLYPGSLVDVKIHCRWRTCAWWLGRTIASTFDLGLL